MSKFKLKEGIEGLVIVHHTQTLDRIVTPIKSKEEFELAKRLTNHKDNGFAKIMIIDRDYNICEDWFGYDQESELKRTHNIKTDTILKYYNYNDDTLEELYTKKKNKRINQEKEGWRRAEKRWDDKLKGILEVKRKLKFLEKEGYEFRIYDTDFDKQKYMHGNYPELYLDDVIIEADINILNERGVFNCEGGSGARSFHHYLEYTYESFLNEFTKKA